MRGPGNMENGSRAGAPSAQKRALCDFSRQATSL
jgi:hypothetical protein